MPMKKFVALEKRVFYSAEEVANKIKSVLEIIFSESTVEDLNYIIPRLVPFYVACRYGNYGNCFFLHIRGRGYLCGE